MSWDSPSPIDNMWEACGTVTERLDTVISLLRELIQMIDVRALPAEPTGEEP